MQDEIVVFSFQPNWIENIKIQYKFNTAISINKSFVEQRRAMREKELREMDIKISLNSFYKDLLLNKLLYAKDKRIAMPIFTEGVTLSTAPLLGETTIYFSSETSKFWNLQNNCNYVLFIQDYKTFELKEIDSIDADKIILTEAITVNLDSTTKVYPVMLSINDNIELDYITNNCYEMNLHFKEIVKVVEGIGSVWVDPVPPRTPKLWVLGGYDNVTGLKNDIWMSENGTDWTEISAIGTHWGQRSLFAYCVFQNKLWISGGYNGSVLSDVWYTEDGEYWVKATDNFGEAKYSHGMSVLGDKMIIYCGKNTTDIYNYSDKVYWSEDGVTWIEATGTTFSQREFGWVGESIFDRIWVLGGSASGGSATSRIIYSYNGNDWINDGTGKISNCILPASAILENVLYVFNGNIATYRYTSDGSSWSSAAANGMGNRRAHAAATLENGLTYLIGGLVSSTYYKDVWTMDSSRVFTNLGNATFTARYGHGVVAF